MAKATAKKRWFQLIAPKIFNDNVIGDIPSFEAKTLIGKSIKINLAILTNDMRKQSTEVRLIISNVEGDKAKTELIGLTVVPTSIKRFVRKGKTRLDQTVKAITNDEKVVTLKILIVARNIIQGSVKASIQKEIKRFIIKKISVLNYGELSESIVFNKLVRELKEKLCKIYPLKICDVREFKLERSLKAMDLRRIKSDIIKESKRVVKSEEVSEEEKENADEPKKEEPEQKKEETSEQKEEPVKEEAKE